MTLDCDSVATLLVARPLGVLAEEDRLSLEQHLQACGACAARVSRVEEALVEIVPEKLEAPADSWQRIKEGIARLERGEPVVTLTCTYCHDALARTSAVVYCATCLAPCHEDCWKEHGGCAVMGCRGERVLRPESLVPPRRARHPATKAWSRESKIGVGLVAAAAVLTVVTLNALVVSPPAGARSPYVYRALERIGVGESRIVEEPLPTGARVRADSGLGYVDSTVRVERLLSEETGIVHLLVTGLGKGDAHYDLELDGAKSIRFRFDVSGEHRHAALLRARQAHYASLTESELRLLLDRDGEVARERRDPPRALHAAILAREVALVLAGRSQPKSVELLRKADEAVVYAQATWVAEVTARKTVIALRGESATPEELEELVRVIGDRCDADSVRYAFLLERRFGWELTDLSCIEEKVEELPPPPVAVAPREPPPAVAEPEPERDPPATVPPTEKVQVAIVSSLVGASRVFTIRGKTVYPEGTKLLVALRHAKHTSYFTRAWSIVRNGELTVTFGPYRKTIPGGAIAADVWFSFEDQPSPVKVALKAGNYFAHDPPSASEVRVRFSAIDESRAAELSESERLEKEQIDRARTALLEARDGVTKALQNGSTAPIMDLQADTKRTLDLVARAKAGRQFDLFPDAITHVATLAQAIIEEANALQAPDQIRYRAQETAAKKIEIASDWLKKFFDDPHYIDRAWSVVNGIAAERARERAQVRRVARAQTHVINGLNRKSSKPIEPLEKFSIEARDPVVTPTREYVFEESGELQFGPGYRLSFKLSAELVYLATRRSGSSEFVNLAHPDEDTTESLPRLG